MKARAPISIKLIAAHEPEESTERQSHLPRSKKPRVEEPEILRTHKVRVFPDAAQRVLIHKWYGGARYKYIKCVALSNAYWADGKKFPDLTGLNRLFANATSTLVAEQPWSSTDVPLEVSAVDELWIARSVNLNVIKRKPWSASRKLSFVSAVRRVKSLCCIGLQMASLDVARFVALICNIMFSSLYESQTPRRRTSNMRVAERGALVSHEGVRRH